MLVLSSESESSYISIQIFLIAEGQCKRICQSAITCFTQAAFFLYVFSYLYTSNIWSFNALFSSSGRQINLQTSKAYPFPHEWNEEYWDCLAWLNKDIILCRFCGRSRERLNGPLEVILFNLSGEARKPRADCQDHIQVTYHANDKTGVNISSISFSVIALAHAGLTK